MPCNYDTAGPTYLGFILLAQHCKSSRKKDNEFNVCEKWLFSIRDARTYIEEKSSEYNKNVKALNHKKEVIKHQTIQTLGKAFEYNQHRKFSAIRLPLLYLEVPTQKRNLINKFRKKCMS